MDLVVTNLVLVWPSYVQHPEVVKVMVEHRPDAAKRASKQDWRRFVFMMNKGRKAYPIGMRRKRQR